MTWRASFITPEKADFDLASLEERLLELDGVGQVEARRQTAIEV